MAERERLHVAPTQHAWLILESFYITSLTDVELTASETLSLEEEEEEGGEGREGEVTDSSLHMQRESWT